MDDEDAVLSPGEKVLLGLRILFQAINMESFNRRGVRAQRPFCVFNMAESYTARMLCRAALNALEHKEDTEPELAAFRDYGVRLVEQGVEEARQK
jgi:hypothetical protein